MIKAIKYKTCKDRTKYSKDRQIIIKIEIMHSTNNTEKQIMYICVYIYVHTYLLYTHTHTYVYICIQASGSDDKESTCSAGVPGSIPGIRRSPRLPTPDMK